VVAQGAGGAGVADLDAADLAVEVGEGAEEAVDLGDVGADLLVDVGLGLGEAGVGLVEAIDEEGGFLEEGLALADVGGAGGEALEGVEEVVEGGGEAAGGGVGAGAGDLGGAVDGLAEGGLGAGVELLLGLEAALEGDLAHDLLVEQAVAELLDAEDLDAEGLGALGGDDGAAVAEEDALAGVGGVVEVGEVLAGGLNGPALRGERLDGRAESGEEAGHGRFSIAVGGVRSADWWQQRVVSGWVVAGSFYNPRFAVRIGISRRLGRRGRGGGWRRRRGRGGRRSG